MEAMPQLMLAHYLPKLMKSLGRYLATAVCSFLFVAAVIAALPTENAHAQGGQMKWLDVGDHAHAYSNTGSIGLGGPGNVWPYIKGTTGFVTGYHDGFELWIGAKNWTDEEGKKWPYKIAYTSERNSNIGLSVFPQKFQAISKYPPRDVVVDLVEDYRTAPDNEIVEKVNPDMKADRMILMEVNTNLGVKLTKRIYAFSQEYHDDYHVIEMVLTNTGNVDGDDQVELPEQTVEGLYLWWDRRWGQTWKTADVVGREMRWGRENMHDIVRDADMRANYTWAGRRNGFTDWDPMGAPAIESTGASFPSGQDTTGRLHAIGYATTFALHADKSASDRSEDINQPATMWYHDANAANGTGTDQANIAQMQEHYEEWFESGIADPFHAETIEPSGDFAHQTPRQYPNAAGVRTAQGYGPYTLAPGDSIRIVVGEGVSGLPYNAALEIGRKYKRLWEKGEEHWYDDIAYDANGDGTIQEEERMDKNEWAVDAARDTLFKVIRRAMANYDSGFEIPQPPPPPTNFKVNSDVGGISMSWEYPYNNPAGGFEVYRAKNFFQGTVENDYEYQLVGKLPEDARSFKDTTEVFRGVNYFYYLTAVGEVNTDATGNTPTGTPLKSSRYYTQTYAPATLLREPGDKLSNARIVPNPFHVGATSNLRYPGAERIGFLDIPGNSTIKIYTERGDLVKEIHHTDGTGDEFWNLQTDAQQMLVSGLYVAAIEDHETGDTIFKKFIVVR